MPSEAEANSELNALIDSLDGSSAYGQPAWLATAVCASRDCTYVAGMFDDSGNWQVKRVLVSGENEHLVFGSWETKEGNELAAIKSSEFGSSL